MDRRRAGVRGSGPMGFDAVQVSPAHGAHPGRRVVRLRLSSPTLKLSILTRRSLASLAPVDSLSAGLLQPDEPLGDEAEFDDMVQAVPSRAWRSSLTPS